MVCEDCSKIKKQNEDLKEVLESKKKECDELRDRFKAISASYCFCLSTDFD